MYIYREEDKNMTNKQLRKQNRELRRDLKQAMKEIQELDGIVAQQLAYIKFLESRVDRGVRITVDNTGLVVDVRR